MQNRLFNSHPLYLYPPSLVKHDWTNLCQKIGYTWELHNFPLYAVVHHDIGINTLFEHIVELNYTSEIIYIRSDMSEHY